MTTVLTKILIVSAILGVAAVLGAARLQRWLTYFPDTARIAPTEVGLDAVNELTLETSDGARLIAWYGKAQPGQPTLLYFHGNAGSLATRAERIKKYLTRGRGVFMLSYRGFGGSTGTPSEHMNVADAKLAYDTLVTSGVKPEDIVLYGESLGSGVAVQVAAEKAASAVVLDAPYTSLVDVGRLHYPWLPVSLLAVDRYETVKVIGKLRVPLFVVHGELDAVIPVAMGRTVLAAAGGPKEMVTFPFAGHADHYVYGSFEAINAWIDKLRNGAANNAPT